MCGKAEPSVCEKLVLGTVSSTIGNIIVYPLLFARTRLQANRQADETTCKVLKQVWRRYGICGWYRGFSLHMLKIGPAASISYVVFESVTKSFAINSLQ
jgi:solute carrier family 25 phosphate transporter 23/24/25/41